MSACATDRREVTVFSVQDTRDGHNVRFLSVEGSLDVAKLVAEDDLDLDLCCLDCYGQGDPATQWPTITWTELLEEREWQGGTVEGHRWRIRSWTVGVPA